MPVWRCPHCATPQAEASRCWVCRRSTTSCVTCRHYRRGISGGLGLCGLDPRHAPVADTDVRACWVGATPPSHDDGDDTASPGARRHRGPASGDRAAFPGGRTPRTFVPVESITALGEGRAVAVLERRAASVEPELDPAPEPLATPAAELVAAAESVPVMARALATPTPDRPVPGRWWLWGDPDPWPERQGQRRSWARGRS